MSLILTNPQQWCDVYEVASAKEKYELMMEALENPLSSELIDECDLGMWLVELRDELDSNNLIAEAIALIDQVQQRQPELYAQEFEYLDNLRVKYYLFRNQPELVRSCIAQFKVNPIRSIDPMMEVIELLRYYGATLAAVDLCSSSYHQVMTSPEVISGTEDELASVVLADLVGQVHKQLLLNGEVVDRDFLSAEASKYIDDSNQEWLAEICRSLTTEIAVNQQFIADFEKLTEREENLRSLSMAFSTYVATQKQISFITSLGIWETVIEFLESLNLPRKRLTHPDTYFAFSQEQLDEYLGRLIGGLLSNRQAEAAALLWGIPYLYDFLLSKQVISEAIHQKALAITTALKLRFIKVFETHLWQYDFVHRWLLPNSISEADFAAEADKFATSIEKITPLAEEPGKGTLESFYSQLKDEVFSTEVFESEIDTTFEESTSLPSTVASNTPELKPIKSPKKRKTPLQQAAELPSKDTNSNNKQKKKKK